MIVQVSITVLEFIYLFIYLFYISVNKCFGKIIIIIIILFIFIIIIILLIFLIIFIINFFFGGGHKLHNPKMKKQKRKQTVKYIKTNRLGT